MTAIHLKPAHEQVIRNVLTAYLNGLDFADALHLGLSHKVEALLAFDKSFVKQASMASQSMTVQHVLIVNFITDKTLPIDIKVPTAASLAANKEAGQIARISQPRFATIEALASDFEKAHYTRHQESSQQCN